jgi:hypothetical protein
LRWFGLSYSLGRLLFQALKKAQLAATSYAEVKIDYGVIIPC